MSGKKQIHPNQRIPPDGTIRHSQLISTYGPGSMMDLVHDAVLIGGTDRWKDDSIVPIKEPRLRDTLATQLRAVMDLDVATPFRRPPTGDDQHPNHGNGVYAYRFPSVRVCQGCRKLVPVGALQEKKQRFFHACDGEKLSTAVPVRFVVTCPSGHLNDFPWSSFVKHLEGQGCKTTDMRLIEGQSGDFSEITVECGRCKEKQPLSTAYAPEALGNCWGGRPWLGRDAQETCEHNARLLVRTASNSYFPKVVSALSIPEESTALQDAVAKVWGGLEGVGSVEDVAGARKFNRDVRVHLEKYGDESVFKAIETRRKGEIPKRDDLRLAEFKQLIGQREEEFRGELAGEHDREFFARTLPAKYAPARIEKLVIAPRLREVRALVGFTRLEPEVPDLEGRFLDVKPAQLGLNSTWLPAVEIMGEGLFFSLREGDLRAWEDRPAVIARTEILRKAYDQWSQDVQGKPLSFPGARFYLLHSLSHLLMAAIALECGYAASSLRERIYCSEVGQKGLPFAGVLISTGAASSEGTLGGLVEQGRHFHEHLRRAWDIASLCSNDPGCASHDPSDVRDRRFLEGAACHGCLFVAECSCERFNNFLDRTLIAPALGQPDDLAFFRERP